MEVDIGQRVAATRCPVCSHRVPPTTSCWLCRGLDAIPVVIYDRWVAAGSQQTEDTDDRY